jgi:hypothetical protein
MQRKNLIASAALAVAAFGAIPGTAGAQEILTGDTRLACEAILCLATGTQPSECTPSLRRYFSISYRKLSDTIRGRVNFLNLCPGFLSGEGIGSRRGTMTAPWPNTTPASRQKTKSAAAPVGAAVATKGT